MFMFVKPTKNEQKATPAKPHVCHKKKNTYIVRLNGLMTNAAMFGACKTTPLPVTMKNGRVSQATTGWMSCTEFPNPCAALMQDEYPNLVPYMGDRMASTIIEYLDKDTGEPIAYVFPTSVYVRDGHEENFMSRMNHASRRDFNHQLKIRDAALSQMQIAHQY